MSILSAEWRYFVNNCSSLVSDSYFYIYYNIRVAIFAGWASRVYFSDNGSTAIEIALKMAFRKFSVDHGLIPDFDDTTNERPVELMVGVFSL